jgi:hypothetical protein
MSAIAASGEEPFDDDEWRALAAGDVKVQNRVVARFSPELRAKFEASLPSVELATNAEKETFLRLFRFFTGGRQLSEDATLVAFVNIISGHVMQEILRAQNFSSANK